LIHAPKNCRFGEFHPHQQDDKLLALLVLALPAPSSSASSTGFGLAPEPLVMLRRSQYWAWRQYSYLPPL